MKSKALPIIAVILMAAFLQITKLSAQPAEEELIRVAACSLLETSPPPLYYRTEEGEYERFFIINNSRNRYHTLRETNQLQLYREAETPEGATVYQPSITFDLISGVKHQLFLLHHKANKGYAMQAINSEADAHPGGVIRLLNLLERPVAVQIDDQRFEVAPGQSQDLEVESSGAVEKGFLFTYAYPRERMRPYVSSTKRIRLRNQESRLLIVFNQSFEELQGSEGQKKQLISKPRAALLYDTVPSEPEN